MEQTGTTSRAVINLFLSIQRRFQRCDWLHPIYAQLTHSSISFPATTPNVVPNACFQSLLGFLFLFHLNSFKGKQELYSRLCWNSDEPKVSRMEVGRKRRGQTDRNKKGLRTLVERRLDSKNGERAVSPKV